MLCKSSHAFVLAIATLVLAEEKLPIKSVSKEEPKKQGKRGLFGLGYGFGDHDGLYSGYGYDGYSLGGYGLLDDHHHVKHVTITKEVAHPVAVPVPVEKHVPVPVPVKVAVPVDRPYPVHVPKPYPVHVPYPVKVYVEKHVPLLVKDYHHHDLHDYGHSIDHGFASSYSYHH